MSSGSPLQFKPTLQQIAPQIQRIAAAMCGDSKAAAAITRDVLRRSGILFNRWKDSDEAQRWFLRFTILRCRQQPSPANSRLDPLFQAAGTDSYRAVVVALRHLPEQQREALLLHHGEGLDLRQTAIAMDCSSTAAINHLKAATDSLNDIAIGGVDGFLSTLPAMMNWLTPDIAMLNVQVDRVILRHRQRVWVNRLVFRPLKILLLLVIGWIIWKYARLMG